MRKKRLVGMVAWLSKLLLVAAMLGPCLAGAAAVPATGSLGQAPAGIEERPMVQLLAWLLDPKTQEAAYREIKRRKDLAAVPGLIELMRVPTFSKHADMAKLARALRNLTGERFGKNWLAWSEWQSRQDSVDLPDQFLLWKASLFGLIDPALQKFLETPHPVKIRPEEILWGGVKKDGIPSLDNPPVVEAAGADFMNDSDLVFGARIDGEARAYPLRILGWHEMLNDVIGGRPVSLAYCTLCRSGILFDTTVGSRTLTFGSSGFLHQSNKLMYDRQTESLWTTIPGIPVLGPLSTQGLELRKLPLVVTSWKEWVGKHPDTLVLSLETGFQRDYSPGEAYRDYFNSRDIWFPLSRKDRRVEAKEEVFAVTLQGTPKAYVLKALRGRSVLNDAIGDTTLVVLTSPDGAVRAYQRGEHQFQKWAEEDSLQDAQGVRWRVEEDQLVQTSSGESLGRLPGHMAYWFGWFAFYPHTLLFDGSP